MAEQTLKYNNAEELKKEIEGLKVKLKELQKKEKAELLDKRIKKVGLGTKVSLDFKGNKITGVIYGLSMDGRAKIKFDKPVGKTKSVNRLLNNIDLE